jgi:hypothetical protein
MIDGSWSPEAGLEDQAQSAVGKLWLYRRQPHSHSYYAVVGLLIIVTRAILSDYCDGFRL